MRLTNTVIIIPARWNSTRFPGKPLVDILGESLIYRVWKQCVKAINFRNVYIATDDDRIKEHCQDHCMQYVMTDKECLTGTDRVYQAYKKIGKDYDIIINVQGDEPLINYKDILKVAKEHEENSFEVCCGVCKIKSEEEFRNPDIIKIIINNDNDLLYASRAGIPTDKKLDFHVAYKQVCIYAFSSYHLNWFYSNRMTDLERIEDIEILRFLEGEGRIKMVEVSESSISVDIPEDIIKVEEALKGE